MGCVAGMGEVGIKVTARGGGIGGRVDGIGLVVGLIEAPIVFCGGRSTACVAHQTIESETLEIPIEHSQARIEEKDG